MRGGLECIAADIGRRPVEMTRRAAIGRYLAMRPGTGHRFRVGQEMRKLARVAVRGGEIIRIQPCDKGGGGKGQPGIHRCRNAAAPAPQQMDAGVFLRQRRHQFTRRIGAAIIDDDHPQAGGRLVQNGPDGRHNGGGGVAGGHDHVDGRKVHSLR